MKRPLSSPYYPEAKKILISRGVKIFAKNSIEPTDCVVVGLGFHICMHRAILQKNSSILSMSFTSTNTIILPGQYSEDVATEFFKNFYECLTPDVAGMQPTEFQTYIELCELLAPDFLTTAIRSALGVACLDIALIVAHPEFQEACDDDSSFQLTQVDYQRLLKFVEIIWRKHRSVIEQSKLGQFVWWAFMLADMDLDISLIQDLEIGSWTFAKVAVLWWSRRGILDRPIPFQFSKALFERPDNEILLGIRCFRERVGLQVSPELLGEALTKISTSWRETMDFDLF